MTSKEAIEIAKKAVIVAKQQRQNEADDEENEWFDSNIEGLKQAEKDLEILEILKPMLEVKKGGTWEYLDTKHCFFETKEQITKVKEWLEKED